MSPSSPVRTRQSRRPPSRIAAESNQSPRGETTVFVFRSAFLVFAAVSVIAASDYLAYLVGRKQVTYEELRRQVDLFGKVMEQKRVEGELAITTPKERQDRFEQRGSALTDLTTSTINGKTVVAPELAIAPSDRASRLQPPELSPAAAVKHREVPRAAHQRIVRKPPARRASAGLPASEQSQQFTTAAPDTGLAGQ